VTDLPPTPELRQLVSAACRILENEGQEHFFLGHVSARMPGSHLVCVKPSGLGLGEIQPDDLVVVDLDGQRIEGERPIHNEMPIHLETYRARPDVTCVVHTHPFHAAAFSSAAAEFAMVSQDSVLFADGIGRYASPELVVSPEQGRRLADALGQRQVVVLKNHGITVVGPTVQEATFLAVSFDRSLRLQIAAAQLGPLDPIAPAEVTAMHTYFHTRYEGRVQTMWNYLLRRADRANPHADGISGARAATRYSEI
jgi:L-fuculose-phosphate aldolase